MRTVTPPLRLPHAPPRPGPRAGLLELLLDPAARGEHVVRLAVLWLCDAERERERERAWDMADFIPLIIMNP